MDDAIATILAAAEWAAADREYIPGRELPATYAAAWYGATHCERYRTYHYIGAGLVEGNRLAWEWTGLS